MKRPSSFAQPVYVTRPLLPSFDNFAAELREVWESGWLTNGGAQHIRFESELTAYLEASNLSLFNNGTIALIVACQALELRGEVITTPFTFPATPHVLSWNNLTPVFADIDPETLCLDPASVEAAVTERTSAILGVHVYGTPCDVVALEQISAHHGLRVIYDAAHAFSTRIDGRPVADWGDATMFSLHATKLFHSAEGGALVVGDPELKARIDLLKNFGIRNEDEVLMPGINGKMSEIHAALGRVVLREVEGERQRRASLREIYRQRLGDQVGLRLQQLPPQVSDSLQYLVLRVSDEETGCDRDTLHARLKRFNIITRKYFYPLCCDYACYRDLPSAKPECLPVARRIAREVLALPFHGALSADDVHHICDAIVYSRHA